MTGKEATTGGGVDASRFVDATGEVDSSRLLDSSGEVGSSLSVTTPGGVDETGGVDATGGVDGGGTAGGTSGVVGATAGPSDRCWKTIGGSMRGSGGAPDPSAPFGPASPPAAS